MLIRSAVAATLLASGFASAAGVAGAQQWPPHGYARSDAVNSVVYRDLDGRIHELALAPGGAWAHADLTGVTGAPAAATDPAPYVRHTYGCCLATNSVVYVAANGNIIDLNYTPNQGGWHLDNLTALSGAPLAVLTAAPSAITRSDIGGNLIWSVTFKGQSNGHLYEIKRFDNGGGSTWLVEDLTASSGAPMAFGVPNTAAVWGGFQDIFYRGGFGHVIHLQRYWTNPWLVENLTATTGGPMTVADALTATLRPDGYTSVAYRAADDRIYELYQNHTGNPWSVGGPANLAGAPTASSAPAGYVRADNTYSILYRTTSGHVIELHLAGNWHFHDLTALAKAPIVTSGGPSPYLRADGVNSVVYRGVNAHIYELYNFSGDTWSWGDSTALAH